MQCETLSHWTCPTAFPFPLLCEQDRVIHNQSIQKELAAVQLEEGATVMFFSSLPRYLSQITVQGLKEGDSESNPEAAGPSCSL